MCTNHNVPGDVHLLYVFLFPVPDSPLRSRNKSGHLPPMRINYVLAATNTFVPP